MDSHTDDGDTGLPPVGSPEELEEALKWLEELTARQGKPAELSNPVPAASLDSPFRGLIDGEEGDLPDWLREVPHKSNPENFGEGEAESRLDWLAKMAQRESIEELPTLEWRRLSEPVQSSILSLHQEGSEELVSSLVIDDLEPEKDMPEEAEIVEESTGLVESSESLPAPDSSAAGEVDISLETIADQIAGEPVPELEEVESPAQLNEDLSASLMIEADEEIPPMDDLDAAMAWIEELAASQDAPIEDIPSVADRALASKLMMEAGLTPDVSPLDELGSDSSLVEGRTPTHPFIEEEDFADTVVLVETMAADQGVPLEMPDTAASSVLATDVAGEMESAGALTTSESMIPDTTTNLGEITPFETPPEELSFDDAMAYLDEIAVLQISEPETEVGVPADSESPTGEELAAEEEFPGREEPEMESGPEQAIESPTGEPLATEDAPQEATADSAKTAVSALVIKEFVDEDRQDLEIEPSTLEQADAMSDVQLLTESTGDEESQTNGMDQSALESALLALDAMALPPGKTLEDIDATLRTAQIAPLRDIPSALDWLESSLAGVQPTSPKSIPSNEIDDEELIARMPEDPDAVLLWLEQMADAEAATASTSDRPEEKSATFVTSGNPAEPLVVDMAEADLLNMPEDPDEAMAWLESLARGGNSPAEQQAPEIPEPPKSEQQLTTASTEPERIVDEAPSETRTEKPGNKRRRAKRETPKEVPETEEPPAPPAPVNEQPVGSWVDLLKPLD